MALLARPWSLLAIFSGSLFHLSPLLAADVLSDLRSVDHAYLNGLSLSGEEKVPSAMMRPADPGGVFEWRYTHSGRDVALHRWLAVPAPLAYHPEGDSAFLDHDEEGNLIVNVLTDEKYRFSEKDRFYRQRYDRCVVSPAGIVIERVPCDVLEYFPPTSTDCSLPCVRALWGSGRGYSSFLEDLIDERLLDTGRIQLKASGFISPMNRGVWELEVDPGLSYLITRASFLRENRESPSIVVRGDGVQGTAPCEVIGKGSFTVNAGGECTQSFLCDSAKLEVDHELLALCEEAKQGPFPSGSLGSDKRSGKSEVIDLSPPKVLAVMGESEQSWKVWLLVLLHLIVGGCLLMWSKWNSGRIGVQR